MHTRVEDVMTRQVVAVEEKTAYKDIVGVMARQHVSAVPVLDSTGQVRGVVSQSDLLLKETAPDSADELHVSPARRAEWRKAAGTIASELMTSPPVTVPAKASVEEAASMMRRHKINQVLVLNPLSGKLIGIVSRADVLGIYERPDAAIERDIREEIIATEFAMDPHRFDVTVKDGRVTIMGQVENRSQIPQLLRAVRYVEGVVSATSHLGYEKDDEYAMFGPYF